MVPQERILDRDQLMSLIGVFAKVVVNAEVYIEHGEADRPS